MRRMEETDMAVYRKLHIVLTEGQRNELEKLTKSGTAKATEIRRANVLLLADESGGRKRMKDVEIAEVLNVTPQAVHDIKERFLERAQPCASDGIARKKRETPPVPAKVTGEVEAKVTAIACSAPPAGRSRWTLRLIAEKTVEMHIVDSISHTEVARILKKTASSHI